MKTKKKNVYFFSILVLLAEFSCVGIYETKALNNPDYTVDIAVDEYFVIKADLSENDIWEIEFEVTSGGNLKIDFYLVDSYNFERYVNDQSFSVKKVYQGTTYALFNYTIPYDDYYYAIFDNPATFVNTKTVQIKSAISYYEENTDYFYKGTTSYSYPYLLIFGGILLVGIIIGLIIAVVKKSKKKRVIQQTQFQPPFSQNQTQLITQPSGVQRSLPPRFCSNCGARLRGNVCERCGKIF
ncbi:MAG: hypothetical protein ACP6IY_19660 [Promethearchaeia archaeon]